MVDFVWKCRGPSFLKCLKVATAEVRRNAESLKGELPLGRDVLDPTSESLRKSFAPICEYEIWHYCLPGMDPKVHERLFGREPKAEELRAYRQGKRLYQKLIDYVQSVECYCRAGQERLPVAAAKYEFIRLRVLQIGESPCVWQETNKVQEDIRAIFDALNEISILTIGEIVNGAKRLAMENDSAINQSSARKHERCSSRFAGRTIRGLSIAPDGVTFTVCREYVYRITAKQAVVFLDKLIDSYEKTNKPVKAEFQLASVFKRGDAMRLRKKFMVCKNGAVRLNIPD